MNICLAALACQSRLRRGGSARADPRPEVVTGGGGFEDEYETDLDFYDDADLFEDEGGGSSEEENALLGQLRQGQKGSEKCFDDGDCGAAQQVQTLSKSR